jgi:hypothetical protein
VVAHVRSWHIASFRGDAEFGRYRGIAAIDQAAPIKLEICPGELGDIDIRRAAFLTARFASHGFIL